MLKRLAILAVLLIVVPAPAPMPGQAPEAAALGSRKLDSKAQGANGYSARSMPVRNSTQPPADAQRTENPASDDEDHAVKLTSLPPVTIAEKQKTFWDHMYDWGPWIFTALLVVVGFLQVGTMIWQARLLRGTLSEIHTQAGHMASQIQEMQAQTGVARTSADAAKTSADIAVGVSIPTLVVHELRTGDIGAASVEAFFQFPKIKITIKNYGQTPAFLKWWSLCFTCEDLPEVPVYDGPGDGMILDKIAVQPNTAYTLPELPFPHRHEFSLEDVKAIVNREKTFRVYGYVCYGDIFGNPPRRLKFCETVLNIFGTDAICDWWEGFAPPEYTGIEQFPTKKPTQQEAENPN